MLKTCIMRYITDDTTTATVTAATAQGCYIVNIILNYKNEIMKWKIYGAEMCRF